RRCGWRIPSAIEPWLAALRSRPLLTMVGVRLAPLPLGVKNYGLALCEVSIFPYTIAAMAVNMPFSMLWASAGASCRSLSEALSLEGAPAASGAGLLLIKVLPVVAVVALLTGIFWRRLRCAENRGTPDLGAVAKPEGKRE
ncbi:unnamed protein product, partial [Polarella glacialis]